MGEPVQLKLHLGETLMASLMVPSDTIRAPGQLILVYRERLPHTLHPYVTWWLNTQSGGRCSGNYFETYGEAARDFAKRIERHFPQPIGGVAHEDQA